MGGPETDVDLMLAFDLKPQYRADTDQNGSWHVWRRVSARGWATHRRCRSRQDAEALAESLNADVSGSLEQRDAAPMSAPLEPAT